MEQNNAKFSTGSNSLSCE